MQCWSEINRILSSLATETFPALVENIRTYVQGSRETRNRVSFSVALIALSAKMAKADGVVSDSEVRAFHDVFTVPPEEIDNVARLYNIAKGDIAGFDSYAAQVRALFPGDDPADAEILHDVLDALFHIAKADGYVHENELLFLEDIAVVFGFDSVAFDRMKLRHIHQDDADAYTILNAERSWTYERLKAHYYARVAESHPDRLIARGVPPEFITIANDRLAAINAAWEMIEPLHRPQPRQIMHVS